MLESRRQNYYKHSKFTVAFVISLLLHLPIFFIASDLIRSISHQLTFIINIACSYFAFFRYRDDERLYFDYRRKIIPSLLKEINASYKYYPRAKILAKEFVASGLYYNKVSKLSRHDLILGMVQKAAFSVSFVKAQTKEFIGKSGITGTSNSALVTRFQGLHYVFKIPFELMGKTIILPLEEAAFKEVAETNSRNLEVRSKNRNSKRIQTGNSEFDQKFAVFTSFERDAKRFLSPKRIKDILEINRLFKNTIAMSFFSSFVFMHAHTNREVFKFDVTQPIDVNQVTDNYINLKIALKAAELLLN